MHVVTVVFHIKPEHREAFMTQILANARAAIEHEPACRQFDVSVSEKDPCELFLYEIYDDLAGFNAHVKQPHYLEFSQVTQDWVEAKQVRSYTRVE